MKHDNETWDIVKSGWCEKIQPAHPVVSDILSQIPLYQINMYSRIDALLKHLRDIKWIGTHGFHSFESIIETKKGNCLTISCFLCSLALAMSENESYVLVAGGGLLGKTLIATTEKHQGAYKKGYIQITVHAWMVFREKHGKIWIIDPVLMKKESLTNEIDLFKRIRLAAPVDGIWLIAFDTSVLKLFSTAASCFAFFAKR